MYNQTLHFKQALAHDRIIGWPRQLQSQWPNLIFRQIRIPKKFDLLLLQAFRKIALELNNVRHPIFNQKGRCVPPQCAFTCYPVFPNLARFQKIRRVPAVQTRVKTIHRSHQGILL